MVNINKIGITQEPSKLLEYQDRNAIRQVLGCYLNDTSLLRRYPLRETDFVDSFHKIIFATIRNLAESGAKEVNIDMLACYLEEKYPDKYQKYKKLDGDRYIADAKELAHPQSMDVNFQEVQKWSVLRELSHKGIDVSDFFDPKEVDIEEIEKKSDLFNSLSPSEMIGYYQNGLEEVSAKYKRHGKLFFLKVNELKNADKEVEYLIDDFMIQNTFNSIVAPAKAGKSQLAYQIAYCVQNGIDFLGNIAHKADVLYVDFELRENAIKRRFDRLTEYYGLESPEEYKVLSLSGTDDFGLDEVITAIRDEKQRNPKIGLAIFDCYYSFCNGDQNSETDVKNTLRKIKTLAEDMTVIYVHHTNKTGIESVTDAIYASGGSGVHGKIVDETYVINSKKNYIISTGRDWSDREIYYKKDESTNWFFELDDSADARHRINGKTIISTEELQTKYPEICETIGEGISLYKLQKQFPEESSASLRKKGFFYDGRKKYVYLPAYAKAS